MSHTVFMLVMQNAGGAHTKSVELHNRQIGLSWMYSMCRMRRMRGRETERQTDRQRGRQTDRQSDRHMELTLMCSFCRMRERRSGNLVPSMSLIRDTAFLMLKRETDFLDSETNKYA